MPTAETIAIGTELLLGEIQDTNTAYMARKFRDHGIDFYRATIIGDNYKRIGKAIQEALTRSDIIITTGGLGPTVDDPTRQAVAYAMNVDLEFCPELWTQIQERFKRYLRTPTENNRRQAFIPEGATAIENPVGTAPAFFVKFGQKVVISLPGVPREMETILEESVLPMLCQRFDMHGTIKALVLHTAGAGESLVDEWIGDLEMLDNPTVGLLAHPGQVDIRITAKANSVEEADQMIAKMVTVIHERVGDSIYGTDKETLEEVISRLLTVREWKLAVAEYGLDNQIQNRLLAYPAILNSFDCCRRKGRSKRITGQAQRSPEKYPGTNGIRGHLHTRRRTTKPVPVHTHPASHAGSRTLLWRPASIRRILGYSHRTRFHP